MTEKALELIKQYQSLIDEICEVEQQFYSEFDIDKKAETIAKMNIEYIKTKYPNAVLDLDKDYIAPAVTAEGVKSYLKTELHFYLEGEDINKPLKTIEEMQQYIAEDEIDYYLDN